jgi:UDP-glucose:(heptosyl)LPS alpha-1,3-glucosyltransferase
MKVALVCRPLVFHGGVETATAGLLEELVRRGHLLDLLTLPGQPPIPGIRVRPLPVPRQPSALRLLALAWASRRALRDGPYDVVQSHERTLGQHVYRAGEGTHRGYLRAMGRRQAQVNPYHRLVLALENRIFSLRTARHVVAISCRGKAEIERLYGTPPACVTVVYNGVDLVRFHPDMALRWRRVVRGEIGVPADSWLILFVGSGFERKGLGILLEGLSAFGDRGARLVVAGKGDISPYRSLAERLGLAPRITWLGPRSDVERLYAAADLVALPARYEPFGNVHLEALASGIPVLSSALAGGAELIRRGENGWVVGLPDPGSVREGLEALRQCDPSALRAAARRSAEPFTHAAQAAALEVIWRGLRR